MKTTHEKKDMYAIINNMILAKLQQGTLPWKQTWNSFGPARNYVSGKPYRGINALILANSGFEYPLFVTFLQAKELGGYVRKGSESIPVVYYKKLLIGDGDDVKSIPFLRYYSVFNIDCVEGVTFRLPAKYANDPVDHCERIVSGMINKPAIAHGGDEPHYNVKEDTIKIPHRDNFAGSDEYYATLFHELVHSTGHESRLNRESLIKPAPYGSREYCKEELIAEIATCFLCGEAGIESNILDNSASYIRFWNDRLVHILKEDNKAFVRASAQAQKAADYILNRIEEPVLHD